MAFVPAPLFQDFVFIESLYCVEPINPRLRWFLLVSVFTFTPWWVLTIPIVIVYEVVYMRKVCRLIGESWIYPILFRFIFPFVGLVVASYIMTEYVKTYVEVMDD